MTRELRLPGIPLGYVRISRPNFFPMGRLFDICVDTHVEKYIYLNTKEKIKNHDSYKSSSIKADSKNKE